MARGRAKPAEEFWRVQTVSNHHRGRCGDHASTNSLIRLTPGFYEVAADVSPLKHPVNDLANPENNQAKPNRRSVNEKSV